MSNKGIKSAVVVLAVATVMCGCNNSTQAETTKTDTVIGTTDSDINIDDMKSNEHVDFMDELNQVNYSYEQAILSGQKPNKMVDSKNFKYEYNEEGYMTKQTILNDAGEEQVVFTYEYDEDNNIVSREDKTVSTNETVRFVDYTSGKEEIYSSSSKETRYNVAEFSFFKDWTLYNYNAANIDGSITLEHDFSTGKKNITTYDTEAFVPLSVETIDSEGNKLKTVMSYDNMLLSEITTYTNDEIISKSVYSYNEAGIEQGYEMLTYDKDDKLIEKSVVTKDEENQELDCITEKYEDNKVIDTSETSVKISDSQ